MPEKTPIPRSRPKTTNKESQAQILDTIIDSPSALAEYLGELKGYIPKGSKGKMSGSNFDWTQEATSDEYKAWKEAQNAVLEYYGSAKNFAAELTREREFLNDPKVYASSDLNTPKSRSPTPSELATQSSGSNEPDEPLPTTAGQSAVPTAGQSAVPTAEQVATPTAEQSAVPTAEQDAAPERSYSDPVDEAIRDIPDDAAESVDYIRALSEAGVPEAQLADIREAAAAPYGGITGLLSAATEVAAASPAEVAATPPTEASATSPNEALASGPPGAQPAGVQDALPLGAVERATAPSPQGSPDPSSLGESPLVPPTNLVPGQTQPGDDGLFQFQLGAEAEAPTGATRYPSSIVSGLELEKRARETKAASEARAGSFWNGDSWSRGFNIETVGALIGRAAESSRFKLDPSYALTAEEITARTKGLPDRYGDFLTRAVSKEHADYLEATARKMYADDNALNDMGVEGFLIRLVTGTLDPVNIPAAFIATPIGVGIAAKTAAGRLMRVGIFGGEAAVVTAIFESALVAENPARENIEIAYAAAFGFVLGGIGGGLTRTPPPVVSMRVHVDEWLKGARQITEDAQNSIAEGIPVTNITEMKRVYEDAIPITQAAEEALAAAQHPRFLTSADPSVEFSNSAVMHEVFEQGQILTKQLEDMSRVEIPLSNIAQSREMMRMAGRLKAVLERGPGPTSDINAMRSLAYEGSIITGRMEADAAARLGSTTKEISSLREAMGEMAERVIKAERTADAMLGMRARGGAIADALPPNMRGPSSNIKEVQDTLFAAREIGRRAEKEAIGTPRTALRRVRGLMAEAELITRQAEYRMAPYTSRSKLYMSPEDIRAGRSITEQARKDGTRNKFSNIDDKPVAPKKPPKVEYTEAAFTKDLKDALRRMMDADEELALAMDIRAAGSMQQGYGRFLQKIIGSTIARLTRKKTLMDASETAARIDPPDGSVNAAKVLRDKEYDELSTQEKRLLASEGAPTVVMGKVRFGIAAQLKKSNHPTVRMLSELVEDVLGNADGSKSAHPVSVKATWDVRRAMSRIMAQVKVDYKDWSKANGYGVARLWKIADFSELVGKAVNQPRVDDLSSLSPSDAAIHRSANEARDLLGDMVEWGAAKKITGFENLKRNDTYLPRSARTDKAEKGFVTYGAGDMHRIVESALIKASDGKMDASVASGLARAWWKGQMSPLVTKQDLNKAITGDNMELLEDLLKKDGRMSDADAEGVIAKLRKTKAQEAIDDAKTPSAKRRMDMDVTHETKVMNKQTGQWDNVSVEDFLETDIQHVMERYTREIFGQGHMQDLLKKFSYRDPEGVEVTPPWQRVMDDIVDTHREHGLTKVQADAQIKTLELVRKTILGIPLEEASWINDFGRMLRDYQFIRVMSMVGAAQFPELANVLAMGGWRATLQHVPEMTKAFGRGSSGRLVDELSDELEMVISGTGSDRLVRGFSNRLDDMGAIEARGFQTADKLLRHGKGITSDISAMSTTNMFLQRLTSRIISQKFLNIAFGTQKMTAKKLATIGLDQADVDKISGLIKKHAKWEDGALGKKIRKFNIDDWNDPETEALFSIAVRRLATRIIQENDIGGMHQWMTTPIGKILGQFRAFQINAYEKQLLYGLHMRDWETFNAWSIGLFIGGLKYAGIQHLRTVGMNDKDREEFLEKRMDPSAWAAGAFQALGASSLIPTAVDTAMIPLGQEQWFGYGRNTQMGSDIVSGNPTVDNVDKLFGGIGGIVGSLTHSDDDVTKGDVKRATGAAPWQNYFAIQAIQNALTQDLPER